AEAASSAGLNTVFGAEISLREGVLPVVCKGVEGYRRLSHLITDAAMSTGEKGSVEYPPLPRVAEQGAGHWIVLAGVEWCEEIDHLIECFGRDNVVLEFPARMLPEDTDHHDVLRSIQTRTGLRGILSTMPTAATRDHVRLAGAKRALALRANLAEAESSLHPMGGTWLRSGGALARAYPQCVDLLATTVEIASECAFTLDLVAPELPRWDTPDGHTEMTWLTHLVKARFDRRYRSRP